MSWTRFLALSHVLVSPEGERHGIVDQALAQQGHARELGLTLPQMLGVPAVVARTRMAATLLRRFALAAQAAHGLALCAPPIALPDMSFHLIWHRRNDASPAQAWLRGLIAATAARL